MNGQTAAVVSTISDDLEANSASDEVSNDHGRRNSGSSTATSSPASSPAHRPLFHVHVTEYCVMAAGDGSQAVSGVGAGLEDHSAATPLYHIEVTSTLSPYSSHTLGRRYDDLLQLHHRLTTTPCAVDGLIAPPLPDRPQLPAPAVVAAVTPLSPSAMPTSGTTLLMNDAGQRDCRLMEKYLQLLLDHPVYGRDAHLERFLSDTAVVDHCDGRVSSPAVGSSRQSLLTRVVRGLQPSYATHPDNDAFFQRQRVWLTHYTPALQHLSAMFAAVIESQHRLSSQLNHLTTALNIGVGWNNGVSGVCQRLRFRFSSAIDEYNKHAVEVCAVSGESTLGVPLHFYCRYTVAEADMLQRRVALLVDYEAALRSLDKHRSTVRQQAAEESARKAKSVLDKCSEMAKEEIHRLRSMRSSELLEGIREMARAQIHSHHIVQTELAKHLRSLEEFPVHVYPVGPLPV